MRRWASWRGSDANKGSILVGPFAAPGVIRFWLCGYPRHVGIEVYAERADTHERCALKPQEDPGETWNMVPLVLPDEWLGKPITLEARDNAVDGGGWVGISEPLNGGANVQLLVALAAFAVNGLVLGTLWLAAARRLAANPPVAPAWTPLLATAAVALLGYGAFWAYFAAPLAGKAFTVGIFAIALWDLVRKGDSDAGIGEDASAAAGILVLIGIFYLALLYLYPTDLDFYPLANGRWKKLAHDNFMPHVFGWALYHGATLHWPGDGWKSSDRPPLQSGWMLLTWVFGSMLGLDDQAAGGTSALWYQLSWVFGLHGLLSSIGMRHGRACAWVAATALCGFFIINSVFTWPKLLSGAFGCGVFGLWALPRKEAVTRAGIVIGGVLAALALLSHAGAAFSFVALAPWIAGRLRRHWRAWAQAFLLFLVLMLPWVAYQDFYEPPGNRLLKMHLAGEIGQDPRGTWQTIRENYAKLSWTTIVNVRRENLSMQIPRDWGWLHDLSKAGAAKRRDAEFFGVFRSLTWWIFGLLAFPVALAFRGRPIDTRGHLDLVAWTLVTTALWCALLYLPGMALVHQGSYCVPITLFALLSMWLELASPWTLLAVLLLQGATFLTTWAVAGDQAGGPACGLPVALAVLAAGATAVLVARENTDWLRAGKFRQL